MIQFDEHILQMGGEKSHHLVSDVLNISKLSSCHGDLLLRLGRRRVGFTIDELVQSD